MLVGRTRAGRLDYWVKIRDVEFEAWVAALFCNGTHVTKYELKTRMLKECSRCNRRFRILLPCLYCEAVTILIQIEKRKNGCAAKTLEKEKNMKKI